MLRHLLILILSYCFLVPHIAYSQDILVSDPKLELKDNSIHITYDILHSRPMDKYSVEIHIEGEDGSKINAVSLTGDIGENIAGGSNKEIVWNLTSDNIKMNAKIFVRINVKVMPQDSMHSRYQSSPGEREFNRTAIILQSLAFPGFGLSRLSGKPHWLRGVAGYTCIAGAVVMNRKAIASYDEITGLGDFDEKNALFEKSLSQDNISEILAYAAIGIWVTDLIWTIAGTSDMNKGLSALSSYDPVSGAPMIGFKYKF